VRGPWVFTATLTKEDSALTPMGGSDTGDVAHELTADGFMVIRRPFKGLIKSGRRMELYGLSLKTSQFGHPAIANAAATPPIHPKWDEPPDPDRRSNPGGRHRS